MRLVIFSHRMRQVLRASLCFFLMLSLDAGLLNAQTPDSTKVTGKLKPVSPPATKKLVPEKVKQIHSNAELQTFKAEIRLLNDAIRQAEKTISSYRNRDFTPNTMFQLSQLYIKRAKLAYSIEMQKFESDLARFDKGILKAEPEEPRINYKPSIDLCQTALKDFPEIDCKEGLLYWYGLCLFEDNKREPAAAVFKELLQQFPQTEYIDEVNFRIGEHYFDLQQYQQAIEVYRQAINKWNNPFFGMALYKLAWSYYKINNFKDAISSFFYLLNDLDMLDSLNCEEMGRSKLDLRDETIAYIAISFSELGGLEISNKFLAEMQGKPDHIIRITHALGDVYQKRDFYEEALSIYNDLLAKYPNYAKAPELQYGIFECYDRMGKSPEAITARKALIQNYAPASKWSQVNYQPEARKMVDELIVKVDFILATPLLAKAEEAVARGDKRTAIENYREFIQNFVKDARAPRAAFNMAECHWDLQEYAQAAKVYQIVVTKFPPNELTEDAAYDRVICYDQLLKQEKAPQPDEMQISIGLRKTKIKVSSKAQKEFLQACNEFVKVIPSGDRTVEVMLKSVEQFFNLEQYEIAQWQLHQLINEITQKHHGQNYYTQAASLMAQIYYKLEKYKDAEKWYALLSKSAIDSAELKDKSLKMMASSRYKIAENLMAQGDTLKAAKEFERIAVRYSGSDVAEVATYDAAIQYENAGQETRAAKLFELFGTRFPKSEYAEQALMRAGILHEKMGNLKRAAQNYMQVYQRDKTSTAAAGALFSAGLAYEQAENWKNAALAFSKFYREYQAEPEKLFESILREARCTYKSKNYLDAKEMLQNTLNYAQQLRDQGIQIDDYFTAEASFLLSEIEFQFFVSIKLEPPLDASIQKKQVVLNVMLQKYIETTKFKIAEWTTASFYKIGQAFENFCQSIRDSPAPTGVSPEEIQVYWSNVNSQLVVPLLGKALEYYEANEKLAQTVNVQNNWVDQSRARALVLKREIGNNQSQANHEIVKKEVPN